MRSFGSKKSLTISQTNGLAISKQLESAQYPHSIGNDISHGVDLTAGLGQHKSACVKC